MIPWHLDNNDLDNINLFKKIMIDKKLDINLINQYYTNSKAIINHKHKK